MPSETNVPQLLDLGTRQPGKPGQRRQGDSICRSLGAADALTHVVSHHSRQGQHIRAECNRRSTEAAAAVNWGTQPPGTSASSPTCWRSPSKIAAKVTPGAQQPRKPCQPLPSASSLSQSLTVSRGLSALACMKTAAAPHVTEPWRHPHEIQCREPRRNEQGCTIFHCILRLRHLSEWLPQSRPAQPDLKAAGDS